MSWLLRIGSLSVLCYSSACNMGNYRWRETKITEEKAEELLKGSFERGQAAISLGSAKRKEMLKKLLMKTQSSSISGSILQAIEYFLQHYHQVTEEE